MCKGVSSHKLQNEHSGDDFIPKMRSFLFRNKSLFKSLKDCM